MSPVGVVAVSDLHYDWRTYGVARRADAHKVLVASVNFAIAKKARLWCFLGDLCNPDSSAEVVAMLDLVFPQLARLEQAGVGEVLIPGNHDVFEDGSGRSTLTPFKAAGFTVVDEPYVGTITWGEDGLNLVFLPFVPSSHKYNPEEFLQQHHKSCYFRAASKAPHPTLVLSHLTDLPGIAGGEEAADMARGRAIRFPYRAVGAIPGRKVVLQGHVHRRQTFRPPGEDYDVHVVGAGARFAFGEERNGETGFTYVEV